MRNTHGFTLLELAVVLVCFGVLFAGGLTMFSTHEQMRRVAETNVLLSEAREALLGYLAVHGRLPCPAQGPGNTGDGSSNCTLTNKAGVLPWATLGVKETDAWGRRFTYKVSPDFVVNLTPSSTGDLIIRDKSEPPAGWEYKNVAAVVISHGPNGVGSFNTQGVKAPGGSTDENDNSFFNVQTSDPYFVIKTPTSNFDDQLIWISGYPALRSWAQARKLP